MFSNFFTLELSDRCTTKLVFGKYIAGLRKGVGERVNHTFWGMHRFTRNKITLVLAHRVTQPPLGDIDDFFVIQVAMRRWNISAWQNR